MSSKAVGKVQSVIYVDVLIFLNMIVTFLLLLAASRLLKQSPTPVRFVIASLLGGASSLIILAPDMGLILSILTKILFSVVIVVAAYDPKSLRALLRQTGYFLAVNFIFAGMMLFASSLPGINLINYNNGAVYINFSFFSLVASCVVCYAVTCILGKITRRKTVAADLETLITTEKGKVCCSAMMDTGNSLTDPFTGESVIIADRFTLGNILPENVSDYLRGENGRNGIKLIPCNTVSGASLLPCFRAERVIVRNGKNTNELKNVQIAVTDTPLTQIILPPEMCEFEKRRKTDASELTAEKNTDCVGNR